jgi:hypothetical protein
VATAPQGVSRASQSAERIAGAASFRALNGL